MAFNSLDFLIFFFITTVLYFVVPKKLQTFFLLAISLFFYGYFIPGYLLILIFLVLVNYIFGRNVNRASTKNRKIFLIIIIILNLTPLVFFKYVNFINTNVSYLAHLIDWNYPLSLLNLILPLGISFYTFKCLSYDIEVYRKNIEPEKRLEIFALYIGIYPEILAGPIDRPQNLIPQLKTGYGFDYNRVTNGLKLMAWGFFQKWVIADRLSLLVNNVFDNPRNFSGLSLIVATFFFAIQIYCDFSAYSDIAIGAGEVLGFKFVKNFNRPYFAYSISDFWRRWHISLSTWLRDYIFLPIAYKTLRKLKNKPFLHIKSESWSYCIASLATLFIAGLWHGANWTYIAWGTLIGFYLIFSYMTKKIRRTIVRSVRLNKYPRLHKIISVFTTFCLICFAWIFFRSNDMNDAGYIITHCFTGILTYIISIINKFNYSDFIQPFALGFNNMDLYIAVISTLILITVQIIQSRSGLRKFISEKPLLVRWIIYLLLVFIIMVYGKFETRSFIYGQF